MTQNSNSMGILCEQRRRGKASYRLNTRKPRELANACLEERTMLGQIIGGLSKDIRQTREGPCRMQAPGNGEDDGRGR